MSCFLFGARIVWKSILPKDNGMDPLNSLKLAMADLWWAPPNLRVIDRPEICHTIDKDNVAAGDGISDDAPTVDALVAEVSEAHVGFESKVVSPRTVRALFKSLERHGYTQDMCTTSGICPSNSLTQSSRHHHSDCDHHGRVAA